MEDWIRFIAEQQRNASSSQSQNASEETPSGAERPASNATTASGSSVEQQDNNTLRQVNPINQSTSANAQASNATLQPQSGNASSMEQLVLYLAAQRSQQQLPQNSNSTQVPQGGLSAAPTVQSTDLDDQLLLQLLQQPGGKELLIASLQRRQAELVSSQVQAPLQVMQQPSWNQTLAAQPPPPPPAPPPPPPPPPTTTTTTTAAQQSCLMLMSQLAAQQQLLALLGRQALAPPYANPPHESNPQGYPDAASGYARTAITDSTPPSSSHSGAASLGPQGVARLPTAESPTGAAATTALPALDLSSLKPAASYQTAVRREDFQSSSRPVAQVAAREERTHDGPEPFPEKLYRILIESEEAGLDYIISFTASGHAFRIYNSDAFVDEIIPKYFRHKKLDSFRRQLNLYGFARVFRGPDQGAYKHEYFQKGRPDLLHRIRSIQSPFSKPAAKTKG